MSKAQKRDKRPKPRNVTKVQSPETWQMSKVQKRDKRPKPRNVTKVQSPETWQMSKAQERDKFPKPRNVTNVQILETWQKSKWFPREAWAGSLIKLYAKDVQFRLPALTRRAHRSTQPKKIRLIFVLFTFLSFFWNGVWEWGVTTCRYQCHTLQPCSWRHWHRLLPTKWLPSGSYCRHFQKNQTSRQQRMWYIFSFKRENIEFVIYLFFKSVHFPL